VKLPVLGRRLPRNVQSCPSFSLSWPRVRTLTWPGLSLRLKRDSSDAAHYSIGEQHLCYKARRFVPLSQCDFASAVWKPTGTSYAQPPNGHLLDCRQASLAHSGLSCNVLYLDTKTEHASSSARGSSGGWSRHHSLTTNFLRNESVPFHLKSPARVRMMSDSMWELMALKDKSQSAQIPSSRKLISSLMNPHLSRPRIYLLLQITLS
jgi:hypothetical protein